MGTYTSDIQKLYVAYFNRPADALGLSFWESAATKYGASVLGQISTAFAASAEYQSTYAGMSNAQIVNQIYRNLFGRDAEVDGLTYWANGLSSGNFTIANAVTTIAAGAQGTDLAAYNAKVSAATKFTAALDTATEILNYSGATANNAAKAWLSTINSSATEAAATTTAALNATISGIVSPASTPPAGQSISLTTDVKAVTGGAGNDLIEGVQALSGTFQLGDAVYGGSGTDTLSLIMQSGGSAQMVTLNGVERVEATILATTTDAASGQLDATRWTGVETLSNSGSLASATLRVSGLAISTTIELQGDTQADINFRGLTSGTDTASVSVIGAGSGSAATALSFASVDLDLDGSGLLDAVTLNVSGTSYVQLEGGDDLRTLTVRGQATDLVVKTTASETLSTLDASGFSGAARFFISGRSEVNVIGGAGNDTFEFGTSLGYGDVVDGGAGNDTVVSTIGNSVIRPTLTSVESATVTLAEAAGGGLDFSAAQSVTTLTVAATAGASATFSGFVGGTINLSDDDVTDVTLDVNANASVTINVGSSTGTVGVATAFVTDALNVTLQSTGSGQSVVNELNVDNDTKTLTIAVGGSAHLDLNEIIASGATSVSITTLGSASASMASAETFTALQNFTISVAGSDGADFTLDDNSVLFNAGRTAYDALDIVSFNAASGADIYVETVQLGTGTFSASGVGPASGYNALTLTMRAGKDSDIGASATMATGVSLNVTGVALDLNLIADGSGDVYVGAVLAGGPHAAGSASGTGWIGSIMVSASVGIGARVNVDNIDGSGVSVTLGAVSVAESGGFVFGSGGITADGAGVTIGALTLATGATATIGNVSASALNALTVVVGQSAAFNLGTFTAIDASGSALMGAISISLAEGASAQLGAAHIDNGSGGYGTTLVSGGSAGDIVVGAVSASSIGALTLNLGTAATATFGVRDANTHGSITVSVASGASAEFADMSGASANGSYGAITLTIGSAAGVNFGDIGSGSGAIGSINITLREGGSADFGDLNATASRISDMLLNVTGGASVSFADLGASSIGTIIVSGSGAVAFGTATATNFAGIDLRNQGSGGTFTIDLSGVTNGVIVEGGRGSTTITSSIGNDEFYLKTGLGSETIRFTSAAQKADSIFRFEVGTADDVIAIAGASGGYAGGLLGGSGIATGDHGINMITASAAGAISIAAGTASGASVVLMQYTAFADLTALTNVLISGGAAAITGVAGGSASGDIVVVWTDGTDSFVTLFNVDKAGSGIGDAAASAIASAHTLATLVSIDMRVTANAMVAANFDIIG